MIAVSTVATTLPPPGKATPSARSMMIATFRAAFTR